jgi:diguanylate cyclase (GGDEF)-like protein
MMSMQATGQDWHWDLGTRVLICMGVAMVVLLVGRQYVALLRNRHLYGDLTDVSTQLENRVAELANVNRWLADLNDSSHHLTSLRQPHAVARAGLEMACTFTGSPGGWIAIGEGADYTVMTYGAVEDLPHADSETLADAERRGLLRSVPLTARGEELGTMLLLEQPGDEPAADLIPLVAAQLGSALDNAKRYEEALQLAERDPLTGLYNHRGIHRRLAGEALRALQSDSELSLIMMDLDDFKVLNDTYGHVAGDSVLRQVSDAIKAVLRHADLAGRVGGDELLLVLPNTSSEGAMQLSERLRVALAARPYQTSGGQSIPVYLSLGVATMPEDAKSVAQLMEMADSNLYASKQRGGNTTTGSTTQREESPEDHGVLGIAGRLLDAVGVRDHYTRRHSEHVVRNALALGEALGLPEESLQTLQTAAMLHDVGKIGVSQELLRRPGSLSEAEEDQVRGHVLLGAHLIMDIPRLAEVAEAVAAHHERYDGTGYPERITGDETPLLGRILAVADAYSAMTLDRPYRKSMSREQAREELLKAAGTQLDPGLVQAFIGMLDARADNPTGEQAAAV